MVKSCIYCKAIIDDNSVLDVCRRCGIGVWGEKMLNAIIANMENAREVGDLYQGSINADPQEKHIKKIAPKSEIAPPIKIESIMSTSEVEL